MNRYPVYIISKGRWKNSLTAKMFINDKVNFKMVVEPQEYINYKKYVDKKYLIKLPFSNLGLGSYPARNWCWEDSIKKGFDRHWLFDDNVRDIYYFNKGNRFSMNATRALEIIEEFTNRYTNIGISGFNYKMFGMPNTKKNKPFRLNCHIYSAMLIYNNVPYRWRLKYNEDADLNLQFLTNKWCLVQFNVFLADKIATMSMRGGNTDELYKHNGRLAMARTLEAMWPQFVKVRWKYGRPQHVINWKKHFKHPLIRRNDIDWEKIKNKKHNFNLVQLKPFKNKQLEKIYKMENEARQNTK